MNLILNIERFKKQKARQTGPAIDKAYVCKVVLSACEIRPCCRCHCHHDLVAQTGAVVPACDSNPEMIDVAVAAVD